MHVFVIGGTGFISGCLTRQLLEAGHHVTTFTRRSKPDPVAAHESRLRTLHGDRHDLADLEAAAGEESFDAVFDMIAYGPEASRKAVKAFRGRVGRFIHCSTISVYMVSGEVACPITEDQDQLPAMEYWPRNPFGMDYGLKKRECEDVLWAAHDEDTFPVSMVRPTYVSGPGDPTARDYFWIERILDEEPLLVPGSGDFAFQLAYVEDVARALVSLLKHPESIGKAYNVASERIVTLNEYLRVLARLLNRSLSEQVHVDQDVFDQLDFSTHPDGDVFPFNTRRTAVFDLRRIQQDLGYRSTPFEEWLADTVDWYRKHFDDHSVGYERRRGETAFARQWEVERDALRKRVLQS